MTPLIRNGRLVAGALDGVQVQKMDGQTAHNLLDLVKKSQAGGRLKAEDVAHIVTAMGTKS